MNGARLEVRPDTEVRLWHPLRRPPAEIEALKGLVAKLRLAPPFPQVEQLSASARWDGRRLRLISADFDSVNAPLKHLPAWNLWVELGLNTAEPEVNASGMLLFVTTGRLHVRRGATAVPRVVMSEVLREVERLTTESRRLRPTS